MKTLSAAVVLFAIFAGCASMRLEKPDIKLMDLKLGEVTLLETSMIARMRIENENNEALHISGGVYRLSLNDIDVGKGMSDEHITVPALGSATQEVTFHLSNLDFITRLRSLIESQDFSYRVDAKLYLAGGFGFGQAIRASREGRFDFLDTAH
jgi:LEA14-like dessication related protein